MKKPFFSIVIPTYNRPRDLKMAIGSILRQSFKNYEIVVNDNSQNLLSKKVCHNFNDTRIRYSQNKKNIGYSRNLYQVIKKARGSYIFILGDDDLILKKDTLTNVFNLIKKFGYGYIRLKYIYYKNFNFLFSHFNTNREKILLVKKNQSNKNIYQFIYEAVFQFISGNVFKNVDINIPELANNDKETSMEEFYIKFLFKACKFGGGYIDSNDIILAKWSVISQGIFDVVDNKIFLEKSWDLIFSDLTTEEKNAWILKQTNDLVLFLPSLKYYSNNLNVLKHMRRTFELNKKLIYNPKYYFSALIALSMPRFIWKTLRDIFQYQKRISTADIKTELAELQKII